MIVTGGTKNYARVCSLLDSVYKNVMQKQNPFEIVFKGISEFDVQSSITGSLHSKTESVKTTDESNKKFLHKAPNPKDVELNQKPQNLKLFDNNLHLADGNGSDDDNDGSLPQPKQLPTLPPPPPLSLFNISSLPDVPQTRANVSRKKLNRSARSKHC